MKPRKDKGKIEGPFVPVLMSTMKSAAWRATSSYARIVYIALKSRYGFDAKNNGRIYLSARDGAEETGFDMKTVARALRELEHYGFIVMTKRHALGVEGKGIATHWRLTELGYMHDPPTKDFLKWNGEPFHEQKSPAYYKRQERNLAKRKAAPQKQNPVPRDGTECTVTRNIQAYRDTEQLSEKVYRAAEHVSEVACTAPRHISRVNHSHLSLSAPELAVQRQRLNELSTRLAVFAPIRVVPETELGRMERS